MPDQYAVIGNPIAHSKSPRIHTLFAEQTGEDLTYGALCVAPEHFVSAVRAFQAAGGRGLNVTVPFKQAAWALADVRSPRAALAGAVNTLDFAPSGRIFGENTDGLGLLRDITVNYHYALAHLRVLIVGAGGATRGILQPLLLERPTEVWIANRTAEKARTLAENFSDLGAVHGCGFDALRGQSFDLIIHATAAGLTETLPPLPDDILAKDGWCYDLMYSHKPTAFVQWGRAHGAVQSLDGLGMLVEQAAQSFLLWRGVLPDTQPVIAALLGERTLDAC